MSSVLIVSGSVRPNSINQHVVPVVVEVAKERGLDTNVANLSELNLPFFDSEVHPASPDYEAKHESVKQWTDMVAGADMVVLVTPEYNHNLSPVQLNAVDWIYKQWNDKPVGLVGYGARSGASQAHAMAREALGAVLQARVGTKQTNLYIGRDVYPDGTMPDIESVKQHIGSTIDELVGLVDK